MGMSPSAMGSQQEEVVGLTARLLVHPKPNVRQSNPLETAVWNSHHDVGTTTSYAPHSPVGRMVSM